MGLLGGVVHAPFGALAAALLLLSVFNIYHQLLPRHLGLDRGLFLGSLLGVIVGTAGVFLGESITNLWSGAQFGLTLGFFLGALVGVITRARYDEGDSLAVRLFLLVGSIFLGALLAASVGLMTGLVFGGEAEGAWGIVLAVLLGGIVCGYLGFFFQSDRLVWVGVGLGILGTAVSLFFRGPIAGLVVGAMAGSASPMLLVAAIGAGGGLLGRGPKAMVVEALEAPREMLLQGLVPYLLPAVATGAIIGALAAGPGGLLLITMLAAFLSMLFGALGDVDGRSGVLITMRSLVETVMLGADDWPLGRLIRVLKGQSRAVILQTAVAGAVFGAVGVLLGSYSAAHIIALCQQWVNWFLAKSYP
ncbi:MAG: hypothetical protein IPJ94_28325 [Chloroflexi bacterium]|nr:hypothetical protein [Chloroflexota bacterium]